MFSLLLALLTAAFVALGIWQVHRLAWKQDLIARVDARVHAAAQPAPLRGEWSAINRDNDEYRHVSATGTYDHKSETYVFAATELGAGYWVLTPLRLADGTSILINRGFVPTNRRDPATRAEGNVGGNVTVSGLLRLSEPNGTLLKSNVPQEERWYSRDVTAIAERRQIGDVAPYFIDADATSNPGGYPVGGLTQIKFPNNHLVYAITWFAMAIMSSGMLGFVLFNDIRARRQIRSRHS